MVLRGALLAGVAVVAAGASTAAAAAPAGPGDVDPGFAKGRGAGIPSPPLQTESALFPQGNGGVIASFGSLAFAGPRSGSDLIGLTRAGLPNGRFAPGGLLSDQSAEATYANASGQVYLAHAGGSEIVVRKLDGATADPTFGSGGTIRVPTSDERSVAALVQSGGKLLILTVPRSDSAPLTVSVVRLLANGRLDPSFGSGGQAVQRFDGRPSPGGQITVGPDARISVRVQAGGSPQLVLSSVLFRLLPSGQPDPSFRARFEGTDTDLGDPPRMTLDRQGRVLLYGSNSRFGYVRRLRFDGEPDPTFDQAALTLPRGAAEAVVVDQLARIVVAGGRTVRVRGKRRNRPQVIRLERDGAVDRSFGSDGTSVVRLARGPLGFGQLAVRGSRIWAAGPYFAPGSTTSSRSIVVRMIGGIDLTAPRIGVRRSCRTGRLTVTVRDGSRLRSMKVRVDGRSRATRAARMRLRVSRAAHRVTVSATDVAGNRAQRRVRVARCGG